MRKQKGITLIALIITIIVLLILAGVTISMLTGENGILNRSTKSATETYHSTVKEQIILGADQYFVDKNRGDYTDTVIKYLLDNQYTSNKGEYYRVEVEKIASTIKTGKGMAKTDGDIYVIEQDSSQTARYVLKYYETESKSKILLYIYENGTIIKPDSTDSNPDSNPDSDPIIPDPEPDKIEPTENDTKVSYIEDLVDLQQAVNGGDTQSGKRFILMNDLDFNDSASYNDATSISYGDLNGDGTTEDIKTELTKGNGFTPIGTSETNQFEGEFYGNGHTVKNIILGQSQSALFKYNKGTISSLILEGQDITTTHMASTIALYNNGTITKCTNKSNVSAPFASGITLYNTGTVTECKNEGNITATMSQNCGGIIGQNTSTSDVTGCKNTGTITSYGGVVGGIVAESTVAITIQNCGNYGNIDVLYNGYVDCGGILGRCGDEDATVTISSCVNDSTITSKTGYDLGGIVGYSASIIINDCTNKGSIDGNNSTTHIGGIIGTTINATITNCENSANITNCITYVGGILGDSSPSGIIGITQCYNTGIIESTTTGNMGIGGIVGYLHNGGITIDDCYNAGQINHPFSDYVGGILGYEPFGATISDVYNTAEISGKMYTGGIVGINNSSSTSIKRAYNTGNIIGNGTSSYDGYVGGIAGKLNGTAINVYNTGDISATTTENVGGIIGIGLSANLSNSYNIGTVNGSSYVGGVLGANSGSTIKNVFTVGSVIGTSNTGIVYGATNSDASTNVYYLSSLTGSPVGLYQMAEKTLADSKSESEMKSKTFVDLLNSNKSEIDEAIQWKSDSKTGFPTLDFTITW